MKWRNQQTTFYFFNIFFEADDRAFKFNQAEKSKSNMFVIKNYLNSRKSLSKATSVEFQISSRYSFNL